ncbi:M28 family metallopeptidase [Aspergillus affinis]|uniref:M28 family metallopeptidase n=1 Tax=Aspergillus affinis TaxID=1070780 RepID=UPI0022FF30FE|nr:transferrin receptor [Aspergillus affinis]KAI9038297.1 transferrin receptor [Aspergillus affinis]
MKIAVLASLVSLALAKGHHGKPPVSPKSFPDDIKLKDLLRGSKVLEDFAYSYPERNRVFGGAAHQDTVDWLYKELKKTGYYDVWKQPQVHLWTRADQSLTVDGESIEAQTMTYSPSVDVSADLAIVSNQGCSPSDYPSDVAGKIALVQRGECTFGEKSVYAAAADAAATIVYNNVAGTVAGTLGAPTSELGPYSAIVGVTKADGETLLDLAKAGAVTVDLVVDSQQENRTTYNVIAQTKGGDPNNVISLGGHTDSVEAGPGINDDGSGIISNLVVAKALTKYSTKHAVRFFFWTAEEFGLLGSEFYVNSLNATELAKLRLYLNFDMIASPNYALLIYDGDGSAYNQSGPAGSAQIEYLFEDYYKSKGLAYFPTQFDGRSDYEAFILSGIPAGGVFTGAEGVKTEEQAKLYGGQAGIAYDENYHAKGDNFTNLNQEAFLLNSKATAFAVATYANDLSTIPKPNTTFSVFQRSSERKRRNAIRRQNPRALSHSHKHGTGCFHSLVEA